MLATWGAMKSLPAIVRGILAKYGSDAHLYLPGVGVVNGFAAGNYVESTGVTPATVDQPVGLVLDGAGTVGSELVTNGDFSNGAAGWSTGALVSITGGAAVFSAAANGANVLQTIGSISTSKLYLVTFTVSSISSGSVSAGVGGALGAIRTTAGTFSEYITPLAGTIYIRARADNTTATIDNISVREVTGIHASQSTSGYRPILRSSSGKYYLQFDGTDDRLSLGSVPFQMSDDHCVVVVASQSITTGTQPVFSCSGTTARVCQVQLVSGQPVVAWVDDSGTLISIPGNVVTTGSIVVITAVKRGNAKTLRQNGVVISTDNNVLGVSTATVSEIGSRSAGSLFHKGNIYSILPIKGTLTDADISLLEQQAARSAGGRLINGVFCDDSDPFQALAASGSASLDLDFTSQTYSIWSN